MSRRVRKGLALALGVLLALSMGTVSWAGSGGGYARFLPGGLEAPRHETTQTEAEDQSTDANDEVTDSSQGAAASSPDPASSSGLPDTSGTGGQSDPITDTFSDPGSSSPSIGTAAGEPSNETLENGTVDNAGSVQDDSPRIAGAVSQEGQAVSLPEGDVFGDTALSSPSGEEEPLASPKPAGLVAVSVSDRSPETGEDGDAEVEREEQELRVPKVLPLALRIANLGTFALLVLFLGFWNWKAVLATRGADIHRDILALCLLAVLCLVASPLSVTFAFFGLGLALTLVATHLTAQTTTKRIVVIALLAVVNVCTLVGYCVTASETVAQMLTAFSRALL